MKLTAPHIDLYRQVVLTQKLLDQLGKLVQGDNFVLGDVALPYSPDTLAYVLADLFSRAVGEEIPPEHSLTEACITFAALQCGRANYPLWRVEPDLARALLETEPPGYTPPGHLPFPGVYVQLPEGLYNVYNELTGLHRVTGLYLCEARFQRRRPDPEAGGEWVEGHLIVGTGHVREVTPQGLDDALIFMLVDERGPLDDPEKWAEGAAQTWRVAQNLLYALRTKNIEARAVKVPQPKSSKKRKRLERRGKLRQYSVLQLTPKDKRGTRRVTARDNTSSRKSPRAHIRRGHWRHYWTLKKEEGFVGVKEREGKPPLYRVARWIRMTKVGDGETLRPKTVMR